MLLGLASFGVQKAESQAGPRCPTLSFPDTVGPFDASFVAIHFAARDDAPSIRVPDRATGEAVTLHATPTLDATHMESVEVGRDTAFAAYLVQVRLTAEGQERLEQASAEFLGERIATVLDGEVVSTAVVRSRLERVQAIPILTTMSEEEACEVAARLEMVLR